MSCFIFLDTSSVKQLYEKQIPLVINTTGPPKCQNLTFPYVCTGKQRRSEKILAPVIWIDLHLGVEIEDLLFFVVVKVESEAKQIVSDM